MVPTEIMVRAAVNKKTIDNRNEWVILMKGLYDIHCHILPGVDDGARNMEESLWMLNKEYQEGVRHVILTPHFRYDMFEPHMNIVTRQFMQLRRAAMNIGDEGMRLYLGCELHSSMDMVECLKKGRRLTLAGSRYVLVEFSNGDEKNYIEERVRSLLMNGFIRSSLMWNVIRLPERYWIFDRAEGYGSTYPGQRRYHQRSGRIRGKNL